MRASGPLRLQDIDDPDDDDSEDDDDLDDDDLDDDDDDDDEEDDDEEEEETWQVSESITTAKDQSRLDFGL